MFFNQLHFLWSEVRVHNLVAELVYVEYPIIDIVGQDAIDHKSIERVESSFLQLAHSHVLVESYSWLSGYRVHHSAFVQSLNQVVFLEASVFEQRKDIVIHFCFAGYGYLPLLPDKPEFEERVADAGEPDCFFQTALNH